MDEPPKSPGASAAQPQLRHQLGILNATCINMSNMIGIGPFITVPPILATRGGPRALLRWLVGAVTAILTAASGRPEFFLRFITGRFRFVLSRSPGGKFVPGSFQGGERGCGDLCRHVSRERSCSSDIMGSSEDRGNSS